MTKEFCIKQTNDNAKQMKIVFFVRRFFPQIGGVEKHALEIAKELVNRHHNVTVITESSENKSSTGFVGGIKVERISVGDDSWLKKFRVWYKLWKLRQLLIESDVIHCHDVFFWYLPYRFLFPLKKVYTTFHGYETTYPPRMKAKVVRKLSELLSFGNICIGDFIKKWYGTVPDFVMYGGVQNIKKTKTKNKKVSTARKIVLIGRFEEDIGIKTYIKSLELLKKKKVTFLFQAYGEGGLKSKLEKFGKVYGFTDNIGTAIEKADVVFCSSYLVMLEVLIRKKIAVAVYENPLKEDYLKMSPFARYSYICESPHEVADVVLSIQTARWKSNTMISKGYRWAREQTWENMTNMYLKLWEK